MLKKSVSINKGSINLAARIFMLTKSALKRKNADKVRPFRNFEKLL